MEIEQSNIQDKLNKLEEGIEKKVEPKIKPVAIKRKRATKKAPAVVVDPREKERERDKRLIRGRFKFHEVPGGTIRFFFALPYKGEKVVHYKFKDEEIVEIPVGVAKHLVNQCKYSVHEHLYDDNGIPSTRIGQRVSRADFYPISDLLEIDTTPSLITVEKV